ncbi:MAG: transcriptional regulator GlxA family with amidase domain [Parasphingorhabdus sp.]|jgi:transcriptional regulator GlxA family with amidase domain
MSEFFYGKVDGEAQCTVGFFLTNAFSMMAFISSLEPLRIANRLSGKALYNWVLISEEGGFVEPTNGMQVKVDCALTEAPDLPVIVVLGPFDPLPYKNKTLNNWLNRMARRDAIICGVDTGAHLMARSGVLKDRRCTIHWENMPGFTNEFPELPASHEIYEHDRHRLTCAGGTASMDMMLYLIEKQQGFELAASISDVLIHPTIRHGNHPQRMNVEARTGVRHAGLLECIELMEANLEQPLTPSELSSMIGVSKRQLERLFRRHLNTTPARYYLGLRLTEAKRLLEQSSMPVIDVAIACGFNSAGHFSYRYRSYYGVSPRTSRTQANHPVSRVID